MVKSVCQRGFIGGFMTKEIRKFPSVLDYRRERLFVLRKNTGMTNKQFSKMLGKQETHISAYCTGRTPVTYEQARELEILLNLDENILDQPTGLLIDQLIDIKEGVKKIMDVTA